MVAPIFSSWCLTPSKLTVCLVRALACRPQPLGPLRSPGPCSGRAAPQTGLALDSAVPSGGDCAPITTQEPRPCDCCWPSADAGSSQLLRPPRHSRLSNGGRGCAAPTQALKPPQAPELAAPGRCTSTFPRALRRSAKDAKESWVATTGSDRAGGRGRGLSALIPARNPGEPTGF